MFHCPLMAPSFPSPQGPPPPHTLLPHRGGGIPVAIKPLPQQRRIRGCILLAAQAALGSQAGQQRPGLLPIGAGTTYAVLWQEGAAGRVHKLQPNRGRARACCLCGVVGGW